MRFSAILLDRKGKKENDSLTASIIGVMLIVLSVIFHIMVIVSMKDKTAEIYGTITMITIATFTFIKITMAIITAVKHKGEYSKLYKAINAIRYSEVAVSLLTMQQSIQYNTYLKFCRVLFLLCSFLCHKNMHLQKCLTFGVHIKTREILSVQYPYREIQISREDHPY